MIRLADIKDVNKVLFITLSFIEESGYKFSINPRKLRELARAFIEDSDKLVLLLVDDKDNIKGILAGNLVSPFYTDDVIAQEMMWYVDKDRRGSMESMRLPLMFIKWASQNKAKGVQFSNLEVLKGDKVSEVYERLGLKKMESAFYKDLN